MTKSQHGKDRAHPQSVRARSLPANWEIALVKATVVADWDSCMAPTPRARGPEEMDRLLRQLGDEQRL